MKQLIVILVTFVVCFLTSWLLSLDWIVERWPRYGLVCILILVELISGFFVFKYITKRDAQKYNNNE